MEDRGEEEKERLLNRPPSGNLSREGSHRFKMSESGGEGLPPCATARKDSRFQVSRTGDELPSEEMGRARAVTEPPPPGKLQERKMSLTGRFTVSGPEPPAGSRPSLAASNESDEATDMPNETLETTLGNETDSTVRQRGVHFSVGERAEPEGEEDRRRSTSEQPDQGNATLNLKSWRNMKTLEHPPIIDFYRNSMDETGVGHSRPSMAQLIHGAQTSIPEEQEIDLINAQTAKLVEEKDPLVAKKSKQMQSPRSVDTGRGSPQAGSPSVPPSATGRVKFGWFKGVFVRCLLNIFGVMLYMRVSWVTGQAGIGLGSGVVLLASVVTTITAISTCAICTNGDVKGGGAYFLISRSLGPEFGGSIGLIFSVANAVSAAMYVVGFAESVRDLLREHGMMIIDGDINDVRLIGFVTCVILMGVVLIGTEFESRMQMGLLGILALSILNYFVGSFLPPKESVVLKGATGYSWNTMMENMLPSFSAEHNFFSVFAIYFPAATGIMAGANISGDLADPQRAIPLGTLLAIVVTTIIYLMTVWATGSSFIRFADGVNPPVWNGSMYMQPNCTAATLLDQGPMDGGCAYGLMNFYQVMEVESWWGPLITAGIFAATLSSALASLMSAPKVFQAVCKDRLFPNIDVFAKGYGKNDEPRRAYLLTFVIAIFITAIGELNAIAPIISNFFLASYALINYACFDQSFADSPGFRPGFKYYNMWVSLAGAVLCVCVMFIVSWATALITFFAFATIFMYILHRKPDVNWGSSTQAHSYRSALSGMWKLASTEEHVKNYRPQFLVMSGNPATRPLLVDFVTNITKGTSLAVCGYVVPHAPTERVYMVLRKLDKQLNEWLKRKKQKCFYTSIANSSMRAGAQALLQTAGLGKLRPNILLIGFKSNWWKNGPTEENMKSINDYFGVIQDAFECNMGVTVLRNGDIGLDFGDRLHLLNEHAGECGAEKKEGDEEKQRLVEKKSSMGVGVAKDSMADLGLGDVSRAVTTETILNLNGVNGDNDEEKGCGTRLRACRHSSRSVVSVERLAHLSQHYIDASSVLINDNDNFLYEMANLYDDDDEDGVDGSHSDNEVEKDLEQGQRAVQETIGKKHFSLRRGRRLTLAQRSLIDDLARFSRKVKRAVIDVWWLYDDGGLTLLLPHLLTIPKSYLEGARLRVFTLCTSSNTMEQEQRGMIALLSKFRIDFHDVQVIADIGRKPNKDTLDEWSHLIAPFCVADGEECGAGMITQSEREAQRDKTCRQLRAGELMREHSIDSDLIVMTLPVPRKGLVSACLYLSWLDAMTRGLPPTLFVRGNQSSVLTFYS